jgi:hypothetical protein
VDATDGDRHHIEEVGPQVVEGDLVEPLVGKLDGVFAQSGAEIFSHDRSSRGVRARRAHGHPASETRIRQIPSDQVEF